MGKIREIAVVVVLQEECVTPFSIVQKVKFHMCEWAWCPFNDETTTQKKTAVAFTKSFITHANSEFSKIKDFTKLKNSLSSHILQF